MRGKFKIGDEVTVVTRITEEGKSRRQEFSGMVIAKKGKGVSQTFTVRKMGPGGVGIERIFPISSPTLEEVKVLANSRTRRAKLYYLRGRKGKAALQV